MNRFFLFLFIVVISVNSNSQKNFEGMITFKIDINVSKSSSKDMLAKLFFKYGDSMQMFYSKEGNFKRKFINSNMYGGLDYQTYNADEGKLFIKDKDVELVKTNDVYVNTLKLISFKQIENEFIVNLDCECYQYVGQAANKKMVTLQFCYSSLMNKINVAAFEKYNDFFVNDYFKKAERPYLKYAMTLDDFSLKFTAVKIENTDLKKLKI